MSWKSRGDGPGVDASFDVVERVVEVEAKGAPLLADGLVEAPQPATHGVDQGGQVVAPERIGGVATGERLGDQDGGAAELLEGHHDRHGEVRDGPDHAFGLGPE